MTVAKRDDRLDGQLVVLLGGSGFFGTHLAQELLSRGARLRIASRRPEQAFRIKPLGNLGQVQFARCDVTRPASVAAVLAGAAAVVNLVGAFAGDLDALQGRGAGRVAAAAKAVGAGAFVHISAIGAEAYGATAYARTKAAGEAAVRAEFPGATVLRPSVLFGSDDSFLNLFAGLISKLPVVPVFGPDKQFQPLFVDDAAAAAAEALADPGRHGGEIYELGGPERIAMLNLNQRIAKAQHRTPLFLPVPDLASATFATATGWLPFAPLSSDQWKLLAAGNMVSGKYPGIDKLGVTPRPLALFLDRWMVRYRKHGRFGDKSRSPA
jgi:uncharacterized protein YbjT (DUF2867 family)